MTTLSPQTTSKISEWFNDYLQPKASSAPEDYFGGPQRASATATTSRPEASGLLSSAAVPNTQPAAAPPPAIPAIASAADQAPAGNPILEAYAKSGGNPNAAVGQTTGGAGPGFEDPNYGNYSAGGPQPSGATSSPAAATPAAPPAPAAAGPAGSAATASTTGTTAGANGVTLLNPDELAKRTIDPNTETVEGRIKSLLDTNSEFVNAARERTKRDANARGLLNSSIAAGAGEEAAINTALQVATPDAAAFGRAGDYNTALLNQATMYNADTKNKMSIEQLAAETQKYIAIQSAAASTANAAMSAAASRYNAEVSSNASRYASDTQARVAADNAAAQRRQAAENDARTLERQNAGNRMTLINNILNNNDIPPERRAALLRQLGENGLADGIYLDPNTPAGSVVHSTGPDLTTSPGGSSEGGSSDAGSDGSDGSGAAGDGY